MRPPRKPATLACCLAGTHDDRAGLVRLLARVMRPGDHVFAIEGSSGPAAPAPVDVPSGINVIRIPGVFIGVAYDLLARSTHHDQMLFFGSGCTVTENDVDRLRATLDAISPGVAALAPHRTSSTVALGARSVIAVSRQVVLDLGGMAYSTYKARGMSAGLIGSGDLFDAFVHEVRRSGWRAEYVTQSANPVAARPAPGGSGAAPAPRGGGGAPREGSASGPGPAAPAGHPSVDAPGAPDTDESVPPSWRIPAELRAAMAPGAGVVVDWFAALLPEDQKRALSGLIGRPATPSSRATAEGWDLLFLVGLLWRSGQVPYAAHLLQTNDLTPFADKAQVAEIRRMLTEAGRPFSVVLEKLGHAQEQLAAVLLELPHGEANAALEAWWELAPGSELVTRTLTRLAPGLGPAEVAAWELRIGRSLQGAATS